MSFRLAERDGYNDLANTCQVRLDAERDGYNDFAVICRPCLDGALRECGKVL